MPYSLHHRLTLHYIHVMHQKRLSAELSVTNGRAKRVNEQFLNSIISTTRLFSAIKELTENASHNVIDVLTLYSPAFNSGRLHFIKQCKIK